MNDPFVERLGRRPCVVFLGPLDPLALLEGLGDLLSAETENQRRQALARFEGGLSQRIEDWRNQLLDLRAEIEARLDELHWYPTTVSYYAHSEEPNLKEIIRLHPDKYQVAAGAEIKSKDKNSYPTVYGASSESINITLN